MILDIIIMTQKSFEVVSIQQLVRKRLRVVILGALHVTKYGPPKILHTKDFTNIDVCENGMLQIGLLFSCFTSGRLYPHRTNQVCVLYIPGTSPFIPEFVSMVILLLTHLTCQTMTSQAGRRG